MSYSELLAKTANANKSIVCFGMDPNLDNFPFNTGNIEEDIIKFYTENLQTFKDHNVLPSAVKPNYAFYAQYGFPGLHALEKVIALAKKFNLPVILDAKRGDIGSTAKAYATEVFDFWKADAVTLSPFLGHDSLQPFIDRVKKDGIGLYILNRTSNPGAHEIQEQKMANNNFLFELIAGKIINWNLETKGNIGAVIGATSIGELEQLSKFYAKSDQIAPLLIPGVGAQGGSAIDVVSTLKNSGIDLEHVRINSSRGLNYAWKKENKPKEFAELNMRALEKLNQEIGFEN